MPAPPPQAPLRNSDDHGPKSVTLATRSPVSAGPVGMAVSTAKAEVTPAPQINSFQAQPEKVVNGSSAKLQWSVSGATTHVRIEPGFDSLPAQGEREVLLSQSRDRKSTRLNSSH